MITINKNNVPSFLKKSKLFETFYDDEIMIPKKYDPTPYIFNKNPYQFSINSVDDLNIIIGILRYWQVLEVPIEVYKFVEVNSSLNYNEIFMEYWDFKLVKELTLSINVQIFPYNFF